MGSTERLLRWAAAGVCIGFGLIGMLHDLPLRTLVWDQTWWGWVAEGLGFSWREWVTSAGVDTGINLAGRTLGIILFAGGISVLFGSRSVVMGFSLFFILLLQHFLLWKNHFWQIGQLLELSLQTGVILLWYFRAYSGWSIRLLIALTFVGHGLYALGFHPVPAHFIMMTQAGLGVGEATARNLLFIVGWLDMIAAVLLLLPLRRSQLMALYWIIPWAVLTTLARLWSYGGLVPWDTLLTQWLPEVIRRLPHVLVPLALWRMLREVRPQVPENG